MMPYFGSRSVRADIVFTFALALGFYLAWLLRDFLVVVYVSGLFAVILSPVVEGLAAVRIGRVRPFRHWAVFALILLVAGLLFLFGFLALPPVLRDLQGLGHQVPERLPTFLDGLRKIPFADQIDTGAIQDSIQSYLSSGATFLLLSFKSWAGKLTQLVAGIVLMVYFILEGHHAYGWFLSFFPPNRRTRLDATLQRAKVRMGRWLLGQGSLMLILGVCSTIVYVAFNVRYAYALGVLTGLLNIIPVLGATVSVVLAVLVAAVDSWSRVAAVAIFFAVYLQVENTFLTPRIMRSRMGLPGLSIFVALLIGSELAGVVGALVSVPTAVLVTELVNEYLVYHEAVE